MIIINKILILIYKKVMWYNHDLFICLIGLKVKINI